MSGRRRYVFRPFSFRYLMMLLLVFFVVYPAVSLFLRDLFVSALGLPPEAFGLLMFLSLFGSYVNLPLTTIETRAPVYSYREVQFFYVKWRIPQMEMGVRKTYVTINLGGAVVPLAVSAYLILWSIPAMSPEPVRSYVNLLMVFVFVALTTYRASRIVKGLGIATPMLGPPTMTALATVAVDLFSPVCCPAQIAYVGGTLGALVGADLLNLGKLPELGAPVVSIGGAGTFDGIYLTGIMSTLLVLMLG